MGILSLDAHHSQVRYGAVSGATLTWTLLANTWVLPLQGLLVAMWLCGQLAGLQRRRSSPRSPEAPQSSGLRHGSTSRPSRRRPPATTRPSAWSRAGRAHPAPPLHPLLPAQRSPSSSSALRVEQRPGPAGCRCSGCSAPSLHGVLLRRRRGTRAAYDRFNTTLKWWPWVMAGTLMALAPFRHGAGQAALGPCRRVLLLPVPLLLRLRPVPSDVVRLEGRCREDRGDVLSHEGRVP